MNNNKRNHETVYTVEYKETRSRVRKEIRPSFNLSNSKLSRHKRHANSAYIFIFKHAQTYGSLKVSLARCY